MARLDEMIRAAVKKTDETNALSDELTALVSRVEEQLDAAGVHVTAWHPTPVLDEREGGWIAGFAKIPGYANEVDRWGFVTRRGENDPKVTALVRAPRKVRVAAAHCLDAIVEAICARVDEIHGSIEGACANVASLVGETKDEPGRSTRRARRGVRESS